MSGYPETSYVFTCNNCRLVYQPDPRLYRQPEEYCPRCGFRLADSRKLRGCRDDEGQNRFSD
jgi:rRNA maturation endonuclease Nob1